MNGATAEPWVRTMRALKSTRISTIGRSQNFFRSLMNAHSSRTNSPISLLPLELSQHVRRRSGNPPDPVGLALPVEPPVHRIAAEQAHDQPDRGDDAVEHHTEQDARVDPRQH